MRQFRKRETESKRFQGVKSRVHSYLLARGGDDAPRATLDIEDENRDELADGLLIMLASPRRASAEEYMSRASDWGRNENVATN